PGGQRARRACRPHGRAAVERDLVRVPAAARVGLVAVAAAEHRSIGRTRVPESSRPAPPLGADGNPEQAVTNTGPRGHAALPPLPRALLQLLRRSPITVFVVGGTPEQREQTARRLHQESIVHDGPFVRVDCSTEEPTLHAALAAWCAGTPGDIATDPVARASGGTLFLDSIESLTPDSQ